MTDDRVLHAPRVQEVLQNHIIQMVGTLEEGDRVITEQQVMVDRNREELRKAAEILADLLEETAPGVASRTLPPAHGGWPGPVQKRVYVSVDEPGNGRSVVIEAGIESSRGFGPPLSRTVISLEGVKS